MIRSWAVCAAVAALFVSTSGTAQRQAVTARSTLRIYLARHGQTDWNVEGRTQGGADIPLNATGRRQAQALEVRLTGIQLDAVYSSTLSRSRETAEIVHGKAPLTSLPGLQERHFGKFEGRLTNDPDTGRDFQRRQLTPDDSLDGGESLNVFRQRVSSTIDMIRKQSSSGSILIVGHSYTNRMILGAILGWTIEQMKSFEQANDELYLLELDSGSPPRLWKFIT